MHEDNVFGTRHKGSIALSVRSFLSIGFIFIFAACALKTRGAFIQKVFVGNRKEVSVWPLSAREGPSFSSFRLPLAREPFHRFLKKIRYVQYGKKVKDARIIKLIIRLLSMLSS